MLAFCAAAHFLLGVLLVLLGATQAEMARELGLDLAQSGLLVAFLMLGLGVGVIAGGPLYDRCPRRPAFVGAMLLVGASLLCAVPGMRFPLWLLLVAAAGLGAGAYETLFIGVVTERYAKRSVRALAAIHACVTAGAVTGPALVEWIATRFHWSASFGALGAGHVALAVAALIAPLPTRAQRSPTRAAESADTLLSVAFLPFAVMLFAYIGVEASLTIFAVPYATDALSLDAQRGRAAISALWLGMMLARIALAALHGAGGARLLVVAGCTAAALLAAAAISGWSSVELFYLAAGASIGAIFPLVVALTAQRFPHARGTSAGLAIGIGSIGGFAVPSLTGALGDAMGVTAAVGSLAIWPALIAGVAALRRGAR